MLQTYKYTDSQIDFLAELNIGFGTIYKTIQRRVARFSEVVMIPEIHFTQIRKRIPKLQPDINNLSLNDSVDGVFDNSELVTTSNETYLKHMKKTETRVCQASRINRYKIKKDRIIQSNNESSLDTKQFDTVVPRCKKQCEKINSAHTEKAYDDQNNFECCDKNGTIYAIRIKNNVVPYEIKSKLRKKEISSLNKYGFEKWMKLKDVRKRGIVKIVYSALKRAY